MKNAAVPNSSLLAKKITRNSSKQTFYTIRFLVDRPRVDDAYRAYAYFRWVDDVIDEDLKAESERRAFLKRQKSLLEKCYQGKTVQNINSHEKMLAELIRNDNEKRSGLQTYLRNFMKVMDFDTKRRGRLISQSELDDYTRCLASGVTEAMHYFIGHGSFAPNDETRYLAVMGAHVTHMLRDTFEDIQAGYYNIPLEVLNSSNIGPEDIQSDAYNAWVKSRVQLARKYFEAGREYMSRVRNPRCRMAGFAYTARFEYLLNIIEKEGYRLRSVYSERKSMTGGLNISLLAFKSVINFHKGSTLASPEVFRS